MRLLAPLLFLLAGAATAQQADPESDPLPPGVIHRLGSTRLLHRGSIRAIAFSPE